MRRKSALLELQELVSQCRASILYKPFKGEIDYNARSFPLDIHENNLTLPDNKDGDPFEWAAKCITRFKNTRPYILIPGAKFDMYGTRHGKGGGWYDRFLSKVPSAWLRIGVIDKSQMSATQLLKQERDEPVNWIIVCDNKLYEVHKIDAIKSRSTKSTPRRFASRSTLKREELV